MIQWISWNSCPLNLLLVGSHRADIIIQGRNNVTRELIEPKSCDRDRRKKGAFPIRPRMFYDQFVHSLCLHNALIVESLLNWICIKRHGYGAILKNCGNCVNNGLE